MRPLHRLVLVIAIGVATSTFAAAQGTAETKAKAEAAFAEGQKAYAAASYLSAAASFELAYSLDPNPAYLFNVAQAYRLGEACRKAATAYRKFIASVSASPNLAKVQQYIEQSDACAKKQEAAPRDPGLVVPGNTPILPAPVEPPRDPGRTKRLVGLGLIVFGTFSVGAGFYFTTVVGDKENKREGLCAPPGGCVWADVVDDANRLQKEGKAAQRNEIIGYTLGGISIAAGVALYMLNRSAETSQAAVSIVPTADGAMAFGGFRF